MIATIIGSSLLFLGISFAASNYSEKHEYCREAMKNPTVFVCMECIDIDHRTEKLEFCERKYSDK
jgi:hypothetical protein